MSCSFWAHCGTPTAPRKPASSIGSSPAAELEARALAVAGDLAGKPREALFAARRMMRGASPERIQTAIEDEVQIYSKLIRSPEAKEAFTAFLEKRKPDFAKARAAQKSEKR